MLSKVLEPDRGNQLLGAVKCWKFMEVTSCWVLLGAGTLWLGAVTCWNYIVVTSCWVLLGAGTPWW